MFWFYWWDFTTECSFVLSRTWDIRWHWLILRWANALMWRLLQDSCSLAEGHLFQLAYFTTVQLSKCGFLCDGSKLLCFFGFTLPIWSVSAKGMFADHPESSASRHGRICPPFVFWLSQVRILSMPAHMSICFGEHSNKQNHGRHSSSFFSSKKKNKGASFFFFDCCIIGLVRFILLLSQSWNLWTRGYASRRPFILGAKCSARELDISSYGFDGWAQFCSGAGNFDRATRPWQRIDPLAKVAGSVQ